MNRCKTCRFAVNWDWRAVIKLTGSDVVHGKGKCECHRYPKVESKHHDDGCGEWKKKPMTRSQASEVLLRLGAEEEIEDKAEREPFYVAIGGNEDYKLIECWKCDRCGQINDVRMSRCSRVHRGYK